MSFKVVSNINYSVPVFFVHLAESVSSTPEVIQYSSPDVLAALQILTSPNSPFPPLSRHKMAAAGPSGTPSPRGAREGLDQPQAAVWHHVTAGNYNSRHAPRCSSAFPVPVPAPVGRASLGKVAQGGRVAAASYPHHVFRRCPPLRYLRHPPQPL